MALRGRDHADVPGFDRRVECGFDPLRLCRRLESRLHIGPVGAVIGSLDGVIRRIGVAPGDVHTGNRRFAGEFVGQPPGAAPPVGAPARGAGCVVHAFVGGVVRQILVVGGQFRPESGTDFATGRGDRRHGREVGHCGSG